MLSSFMLKPLNRILLTFLSVVFLPSVMSAQGGLRPRGDVNCDWEVTIADVNALTDSVLSGARYHSFYSYAADINGDREINIADLNMLVDALLGSELQPVPTYSGTLPVLFINTEGYCNIDSKDEYVAARWWLDAMGTEGYESIGSAQEPLGMLVKGHGNYTWKTCDKKSLRLKLDEKHPLLGMHSNRHFCLLAHGDDNLARLKNTMGFELSRRIGLAYTPAQEPVEVVLNGQYIGLYFLTEKIRVDKHRVNIEKQADGETDAEKITGGWLLEIDNSPKEGEFVYIVEIARSTNPGDSIGICVSHHSPEILSNVQERWLTQYLEEANAAIYTPDKNSTEWEQYIDIDTLAMFYIVGEIMDDLEYFAGSCFMYKHHGDNTKLVFGPVWDFGNSFQRWAIYGDTVFNKFIYQQPTVFTSHWIEEICKFPRFRSAVRRHWREFYGSGFNGLDLDRYINDFVDRIRPAFNAEVLRWPQYDIEYQKIDFSLFIHRKIIWLQSQWGRSSVDPEPQEDPQEQDRATTSPNRNGRISTRGSGSHAR